MTRQTYKIAIEIAEENYHSDGNYEFSEKELDDLLQKENKKECFENNGFVLNDCNAYIEKLENALIKKFIDTNEFKKALAMLGVTL